MVYCNSSSSTAEAEDVSWVKLEPATPGTKPSWNHDREIRERNKNLRQVYAEHDVHYGADVSHPKELEKRTAVATGLRQAQVKKVLEVMQAARNLDLCFLLDATHSMKPHIGGVKDSIRAIVNTLTGGGGTASATVKKIRLALVAYRDFGAEPHFELLDFTDSVDTFRAFCASINTLQVTTDWPEDVFGGLERVAQLNWSTDGSTRVLFHIADAPCHGDQYHDYSAWWTLPLMLVGMRVERYPKGDPEGRAIDQLLGQLSAKNIDYNFGRINGYTDKMVDQFSAIYARGITTCDIKDPAQIYANVVVLSEEAVTRAASLPLQPANTYKEQFFDAAEPDWVLRPLLEGMLLSYELPESIEAIIDGPPLKQRQPVMAQLKVAEKPFAQGKERLAYYGLDMTDPDKPLAIVLKKYKSLQKRIIGSVYERAIQMQTIAAYLASVFTDQLVENVGHGSLTIKFLKTQVFSYPTGTGDAHVFMACERRCPASCTFLKFTNNVNYTMLDQPEGAKPNGVDKEFMCQLTAFSHWTYQVTKGYLMVVDLQGVISGKQEDDKTTTIELTDPAIHCFSPTRFSGTNFGVRGMREFFKGHVCNDICKKMGLTFPVDFVNAGEKEAEADVAGPSCK